MIGILRLHLFLHGCTSLKEKRGRLKPLIYRLQREFCLSVAEMERQDQWQEAVLGCAMINIDARLIQRTLQTVRQWVEVHWQDGQVLDDKIELIG